MPSTVPGTAMASMETNSIKPFALNCRLTTRYEMIMLSSAVMGAEAMDSRKESRKAFSPLYFVNTSLNHFVVRVKS